MISHDNFSDARMSFGGMAAITKMAESTAKSMVGESWCPETLDKSIDALAQEMKLSPDAPGAMVRFRQTLAIGFLFKVICKELCSILVIHCSLNKI